MLRNRKKFCKKIRLRRKNRNTGNRGIKRHSHQSECKHKWRRDGQREEEDLHRRGSVCWDQRQE